MAEIDDLRRRIEQLERRLAKLDALDIPNQALDTASSPTFAGLTDTGGLNLGTATGATAGELAATTTDAQTAATTLNQVLGHNSSGTPAANFGLDTQISLQSSTTLDREVAFVRTIWLVATDATRTVRQTYNVRDSVNRREAFRIESTGTGAAIGFLGATAQGVFVSGGAAPAGGVGAAAGGWDTAAHRDSAITLLNNIRTALVNLGLMS